MQQTTKVKGKTSGAGRRRASDEDIEIEAILDVKEQAGSWKEFHVQYKDNNGTAWLSEKVIEPGLIREFMLKHNKKEDKEEDLPVVTGKVASSSSSSSSTNNDNSLPTVTHVIYRNPTPTPSATIETLEGEEEVEVVAVMEGPHVLSGKKAGGVPDVVVAVVSG